MKYNGFETLGRYINKYPFNKNNIRTVNIYIYTDNTLLLSVTVPRYIWHMNVTDAINDMDKKLYNFKINTFDQKVMKVCIDDHGDFKTLNIFIDEYEDNPMLISS